MASRRQKISVENPANPSHTSHNLTRKPHPPGSCVEEHGTAPVIKCLEFTREATFINNMNGGLKADVTMSLPGHRSALNLVQDRLGHTHTCMHTRQPHMPTHMPAHMSTHKSTHMSAHMSAHTWPASTWFWITLGTNDRTNACTLSLCTGMCVDICVDMCVDLCVDMCVDMCVHMCIHMCVDMCVYKLTCVWTCI